jgi:type IV pilus assembly protein PilO
MATKLTLPAIDLKAFGRQFEGLQGRHPGLWPAVPRFSLLAGIFAGVMLLAYVGYWSSQLSDLSSAESQENTLKSQYADKLISAINVDTLRKQKTLVSAYVSQLQRQLPSKAEMDALLSDITQAGHSRGLQFELFKPGQVVVRDFYAELPIAIRLTGSYHDLGGFASDVANLARIVTLNNLSLQAGEKPGQLTLDAIAKTYRYLDGEEVDKARRNQPKGAAGGAK